MQNHRLFTLLLALFVVTIAPRLAHAHQAPRDERFDLYGDHRPPPRPSTPSGPAHPRVASALSLEAARPVVLVARDRAWDPTGGAALSVCHDGRCAPVRTTETCAAPRCPGAGALLVLEREIAPDLSDFPTDREGYSRELVAMARDPRLVSLAPYYAPHPDPPPAPVRFDTTQSSLRWELSVASGVGFLVEGGTPVGLLTVGGGLRHLWHPRGDEDIVATLWGNSVGADVRARLLFEVPRSDGGTTTAVGIGIAPTLSIMLDDDILRVPTAYAWMMPEIGVMLREDRDPTWYVGWALPIAVLLDEHLALEGRADVLVIGDWPQREDAVEGYLGLSAALVLR